MLNSAYVAGLVKSFCIGSSKGDIAGEDPAASARKQAGSWSLYQQVLL